MLTGAIVQGGHNKLPSQTNTCLFCTLYPHSCVPGKNFPVSHQARLTLEFFGDWLPSQTNTCLFCTLCPHSCVPGKNFPVGHPSQRVLWRLASGKEVATC
uniref:Uncharacterized protein n=1 Tax=Oryza rufipogon TaxID=4529 RepID=A0A0E0NPR5_ORYRU